jgi:hypothetical protein
MMNIESNKIFSEIFEFLNIHTYLRFFILKVSSFKIKQNEHKKYSSDKYQNI